jgi:murein DD-endopeptidase MepM/ murein hydrolase activator NlpD
MRMFKKLWVLPLCLLVGCAVAGEDLGEEPTDPILEAEVEPTGSSEILYAARALAPDDHDHDHALDEPEPLTADEIDDTPTEAIQFAATEAIAAWNSVQGRSAADAQLAVDEEDLDRTVILPQMLRADGLCTTAEYMTGSQNMRIPGGPRLKAPATAFATAADARAFLSTVRAHMPMYLPFSHPDVRLGHGWIYNFGGSHRGQDYSRKDVPSGSDPTFAVRAVAPGRVIAIWWGGGGNIVAIEHTAPDGFRFVTLYYHLRNGKDNDLAQALAIDCSTTSDDRCPKYKLFAQKYPNHVSWGTNAHRILVTVGDRVRGGQQIAWAGNTGPGGAGNGLNDDGSPKSPRGNVHLHTYWGAQHPSEADTFIHVDPYGVYNKQSTGCYDLLQDTMFARVVAPFFENFHNLPLEVLSTYFNYYSGMGMSPRTLSAHRGSGGVRVSGSFQRAIPGGWYTRLYMTEQTFQQRFNEYYAKGMIPRETTVIPNAANSAPRYTATFRPLVSGERFDHRGRMTAQAFTQKWTDLVVNAGWRVGDYFGYRVGSSNYQSALFTSHEARPFYLWTNRTFTDLKAKIDEGMKDGLAPVSVTASELTSGTRYNVILKRQPGCWYWYVGLSKGGYQQTFQNLSSRGYRLEKLQGYADSERYAAVFTLASGQTPAVCP